MATADVASYFGVTRQRVGQIRRADPSFPRHQIVLDGGPIWLRAGIEAWAALHRPDAAIGSVFVPHGARILEAAELVATSIGNNYVGAWHLWLGLVADDSTIRAVFASLGATPALIRRITRRFSPPGERPPPPPFLNPRAQQLLGAAASRASRRGSTAMAAIDLALGLIDADEVGRDGGRRDVVLAGLAARGLDVDELGRRLEAAASDPAAAASFEPRLLLPLRAKRARRPAALRDLLPNPLGHDPWRRKPWGSAFAVRKDQRSLRIDGAQWFFWFDHDGYFVRTLDGRPVGYRWRPPAGEPVNGDLEVLPMPPSDIAYWPDHRH